MGDGDDGEALGCVGGVMALALESMAYCFFSRSVDDAWWVGESRDCGLSLRINMRISEEEEEDEKEEEDERRLEGDGCGKD